MSALPDYIKVNQFVRIAEWVGKVEDVANGGEHTLVLVSSPKQVYRHSTPEWLPYFPELDLIQPATLEEYEKECRAYANRAMQDAERITQMAESVGALL